MTEKRREFVKNEYRAGEIYVHGAGTHFFDAENLFAKECFKTYATFVRMDGQYTGLYGHDDPADSCTLPQAPDEPLSVTIAGDIMPQGDTLRNIVEAYGLSIGFYPEQIKWSNNWVYNNDGKWEIMFVLLADPSGETEYEPAEVLEYYNS